MPIYKTRLRRKEEIADGTMAFHFEKPEGFAYKAGQFGDYTLITPSETDAEGNIRGFSLASAPFEGVIMLQEHKDIVVALKNLIAAATQENKPEHAHFAEKLILHAQNEEEVLYPAAILVGEYLKLRLGELKR